ncbi:MAG: hypothetical protein CL824_00365 [Crocinitomicaceae bacterium]|nr:hypothetical protein [Crocinitomicaceae bacterium]
MKRLFFCLFLLPFFTYSQVNKDSLLNVWKNSSKNKERLNAVNKLIWNVYMVTQPDSAFYYANLQYNLAKKIGDEKSMAKSIEGQGVSKAQKGNYEESKIFFEKSLDVFKKLNDQSAIARNLDFLATTYCKMGSYEKAISMYEKAFLIAKTTKDIRRQSSLYGNRAVIHQKQGQLNQAIECFLKSIKLAKQLLKSSKEGYYPKLNIANAYHNIGNIYTVINDKEKALKYYFKSIKINEKNNFDKYLILNFLSLADFYLSELNLDKALYYNKKSLSKAIEINSPIDIVKNESNIALIYFKKERIKEAQAMIERCIEAVKNSTDKQLIAEVYFISSKIQNNKQTSILNAQKTFDLAYEIGDVQLLKKASYFLYKIYKKENNLDKALEMYEVFVEMRDSLSGDEIKRLKYQQEYLQKAKEDSIINSTKHKFQQSRIKDKELQIQNEIYIKRILIFTVLLVIGVLFLIIKNGISSKKYQKEEYQKLLTQIHLLNTNKKSEISESIVLESDIKINKEIINNQVGNKLNDTDWKIINLICSSPTMAYKEIGAQVFLSVDGVKSSFKKMYDLFEINATGRNKKLALAIKLIKLSEEND